MTATLVFGLLRRYRTAVLWLFVLSLALWAAIIGAPVAADFRLTAAVALGVMSFTAFSVTFGISADKSFLALPLSRMERGRAAWHLATIAPSAVSATALATVATVMLLSGRRRVEPAWIAMMTALLMAVAGTSAAVLSWRAFELFRRRSWMHLVLMLATLFVVPLAAAWCAPVVEQPVGAATWIALLVGAGFNFSGYRHADMLGVFQRSLQSEKVNSAPTLRPHARARRHRGTRFQGRLAPFISDLLRGTVLGGASAIATPALAAIAIRGVQMRDLVATSPQSDSTYGTWMWMALFSLVGPGLMWRESPWVDRRLMRTLPVARRELVTFYVLRSTLPVAVFLGMTAWLNISFRQPVPRWLHLPFIVFVCGASAMALALMRLRVPQSSFPSGSGIFVGGVAMLGLFRAATGEPRVELDASVLGAALIAGAAWMHRRKLITLGSSSVPKRSSFAPPERR